MPPPLRTPLFSGDFYKAVICNGARGAPRKMIFFRHLSGFSRGGGDCPTPGAIPLSCRRMMAQIYQYSVMNSTHTKFTKAW